MQRLHACLAGRLGVNLFGPAKPGGGCRMKRLLLAALLAVLLVCGYYFRGYFFEPATETRTARPPPAQLVAAGVVAEMPVPVEVNAIRTVQPIATVIIKSRVDGEIAQVHFEEGQEVKEGDLLF